MPYKANTDLPKSVKNHLPEHAQTIYRKAYNHAYLEYDRNEESAARVAWAAVKREYMKSEDGTWRKK